MQYDLVFEGGGAKGIVFAGAMNVFEENGHMARRFVGTSAWAITSTLLAAGYSAKKYLAVVNEKLPDGKPVFSTFMDVNRIHNLINTMTNARDKAAIKAHEDEICRLPAKGYGTTEFDMSEDRMAVLIDAGSKAMREYFNVKSTV